MNHVQTGPSSTLHVYLDSFVTNHVLMQSTSQGGSSSGASTTPPQQSAPSPSWLDDPNLPFGSTTESDSSQDIFSTSEDYDDWDDEDAVFIAGQDLNLDTGSDGFGGWTVSPIPNEVPRSAPAKQPKVLKLGF